MVDDDDARWMRRALAHAARGLGRTNPNPVVGCCIVSSDGVVQGDGSHERAGGPHAEVHALEDAGERARGATLYCTLEPCVHVGRTGPCTDRIIGAGIRRVVAALEDPNPLVAGRGFAALRAHGIAVTVGVEALAAERLNGPYLTSMREGRPWVILKSAMSGDGCVAAAVGARTPLTADAALAHAQRVRARVDALAVGSETLLVDDPRLTVRDVYRTRPLVRAVFDRRLRTRPDARVFSTLDAGPLVVLTSAQTAEAATAQVQALERAGARVVALAQATVRSGLQALAAFDVQSVLLEGGPTLQRAALAEAVIDEVQVYVAPAVVGRGGVAWLPEDVAPLHLDGVSARQLGRDVLLEGYVQRTH